MLQLIAALVVSASLMPPGKQTYVDANGAPLAGGRLYTYAAGTSTPLATYSDEAGVTPNTNPVILDARGEASVFWGSAAYKIVLRDANDVTVWTQDNVYALGRVTVGSTPRTFEDHLRTLPDVSWDTVNLGSAYATATGTSTAKTLADQLGVTPSLKNWNVACDGATDDTNAINAMLSVLGSVTKATVRVPGKCRILGTVTFSDNVTLDFGGNGGFDPVGSGTIRIDGTVVAADHQIFYGTRTINLKFARSATDFFNARWWGMGLNSDDDGARLQRAIDSIAGYSYSVFIYRPRRLRIPAGSYILRTGISVDVAGNDLGLSIEGDGSRETYLNCYLDAPGDCFHFFRTSGANFRNLEMKHLWIQGRDGFTRYAIYVQALRRGLFEDLQLQAAGEAGLALDFLMDVDIRKVWASGYSVAGILFLGNTSTSTRITECYLDNNVGTGLRAGDVLGLTIKDSVFESNADFGMKLGSGTDCHPFVQMYGNHFEYNTGGAIRAGDRVNKCAVAAPSYSMIESFGNKYIGQDAGGNTAFYLGNARMVSVGDYVVTFPVVWRVNANGTRTREVVTVGDTNGPGSWDQTRSDWVIGDEVSTWVQNDGTTSPFVQVGSSGERMVPWDPTAAPTITPNPRAGKVVTATLTGDVVVAAPILATNKPALVPMVGSQLEFLFTQDGTGGRSVTWDAVYLMSWSDTGNTANKRASARVIFDGTNWVQQSVTPWW